MAKLNIDYSKTGIGKDQLVALQAEIEKAHDMLHTKSGKGNDFVGWVDLPLNYDKEEFVRIEAAAKRIQDQSDALVVIGIGGSYLGARAAIEALSHAFYNLQTKENRKTPEVFYLGANISGTYLKQLFEVLEGKDVSVNVISKSGTTTEPAIAFRLMKQFMEKKYGKEGAKDRIYATTDKAKGALRTLADQEGYETFIIPDDVGGRYSILTAVGLLPIAVSGISIADMMQGAVDGYNEYKVTTLKDNPCYQYAALRNVLHRDGKNVEIMVNYEPQLHFVAEWWKQLYGESEGKNGKGIFPAAVDFSTDLHSMGQYIQDGQRMLFETVLHVGQPALDVEVPMDENNLDNLNYLAGKTMDFVNKKAFEGTILAHVDGGVPNIVLEIPSLDAYHFGKLMYFFQKACGISGYVLDVNPFDQPGVEAYKKNMFALLGKPGFEDLREELLKRL